jgi:hypothetical protein
MSKFNKQSKTGKLITRQELKRQISVPLSEYHKPLIIQNSNHQSYEKQHLKDTVKTIIEQIRENKVQNKSSGDKTFRDVVHELMKNKSRVYNENVLKLAKSVVLQKQNVEDNLSKDTTIISDTSSINDIEAEDILETHQNKVSDEFNGENEMTLSITTQQPQKIRFGNAVNHNEIIKQILNH